jgi:hypothetical protein
MSSKFFNMGISRGLIHCDSKGLFSIALAQNPGIPGPAFISSKSYFKFSFVSAGLP